MHDTPSNPARRPITFLLIWVVASLVAFAVGSFAVLVGGWSVVDAVTGDAERLLEDGAGFALYLVGAFTLGGIALGFAQRLALRRRLPVGRRWVAASAVGFAVLAGLYLVLYELVPLLVNELTHTLAAGLVLGVLQVPALRGHVSRAGRWVAITAGGFVAAGVISYLLTIAGVPGDMASLLLIPVLATITGTGLLRLMRQPADTRREASGSAVAVTATA